jgi:colanic acid/amylovoran biosynthesis glycosyltransferase
LKIVYFVNQYPKVSHTFIRREILALERLGFDICRIALRGWQDELPDREDRLEQTRTRYILRPGIVALIPVMLATLLRSPIRFLHALHLATTMAGKTDRPFAYHLAYLVEACTLARWAILFGANRVHAHFGTNSAEVAMLANILGAPPYSFTVHGPEEFQRDIGLRDKIHRSAFVAAVSSFGRSQLYLRAPYADWPKVNVIRCGLEAQFYEDYVSPIPAAPRLVCVGRLCEAKGQLLLLDATARLKAKGIRMSLVLVGDGPLRKEIETIAKDRGLEGDVRMTGWISSDQVRDELVASRALVLPSFAEGLPVVIMEAMAVGRPVLSTYIAGIPELVIPGTTGWLIPAGSVEELVAAMEECLVSSVETLQRMGQAGRDRVIAQHSIDTEVTKLMRLFRA